MYIFKIEFWIPTLAVVDYLFFVGHEIAQKVHKTQKKQHKTPLNFLVPSKVIFFHEKCKLLRHH